MLLKKVLAGFYNQRLVTEWDAPWERISFSVRGMGYKTFLSRFIRGACIYSAKCTLMLFLCVHLNKSLNHCVFLRKS